MNSGDDKLNYALIERMEKRMDKFEGLICELRKDVQRLQISSWRLWTGVSVVVFFVSFIIQAGIELLKAH